MSQFNSLRIAQVINETRDTVALTFAVPEELLQQYSYTQGQHLTLRTFIEGEDVRRSYSICSAVQERQLRVAIKRTAGGLFSNWANDNLHEGSEIDVMPPTGTFNVPLSAAQSKNYLAFAAGSGITPMLSIMKTTLIAEPDSTFTLVYGNRASSSVIFKEQLSDLKDTYLARFRLIYVMSRESQDIDLFNGRIGKSKCAELFQKWIRIADFDHAFICGPEQMMHEVTEALQEHGMNKEQIKVELFAAGSQKRSHVANARPIPGKHECDVTLIIDGAQINFTMEKDTESVLDAALKHGVDIRYSCKSGVCATCRCKVVEGKVDMDANYALEDYEVARGFALSCQSFPVSDQVVMSFDLDH